MKRGLIVAAAGALAFCGMAITATSTALASPGWSSPITYKSPAPGAPAIAYQSGGIATVAWLQLVSVSPLKTILHVGTIAPGGHYREQLRIPSNSTLLPAGVSLAVAPNGAAVVTWPALKAPFSTTSQDEELASYRAAHSHTWEKATKIASDGGYQSGESPTVVAAISANGTAAAGVDHLDTSVQSPFGKRIDVAIHRPTGSWGAAAHISPTKDDSEGLVLGFDSAGDLTAAFRVAITPGRYTLAVAQRPASSGVWGSWQDVTGSDVTSDVWGPALGVAPDGSAVIAFEYQHFTGSQTDDVNAVTRKGETGSWSAVTDVALGGVDSAPLAAAVSPSDKAYVLYTFAAGSSADACVGAVRANVGGAFSQPRCLSALDFQLGYTGGIAFRGNDAYFAYSGGPNGSLTKYVPEASRWLNSSSKPDNFTDLASPTTTTHFAGIAPDGEGDIAVFWTSGTKPVLHAAAYDSHGPNLVTAKVPHHTTAHKTVKMSAAFADLWSGLSGKASWSFGDGSKANGSHVSHSYKKPGTYKVTVKAVDHLGNRTTVTYKIKVA